LDESNTWIYSHLHSAANRMTNLARKHESDDKALTNRVLRQLARELLLAQASDWAFLIKTGTARPYATKRVTDHLLRFNRLYDEFISQTLDEDFLSNCEGRDNLFPNVNWRYYIPC
jgi:1,4-alpha-glucan branching enzyme